MVTEQWVVVLQLSWKADVATKGNRNQMRPCQINPSMRCIRPLYGGGRV